MPPPSPRPDDVQRWIDQQPGDDRDALARTWDLAALAGAPAEPGEATDHAWARLDALLDDAPAASPVATDGDAVQAGLAAWQTRGDAKPAESVPTALLPRRGAVWGGLLAAAVVVIVAMFWVQPVTVAAGGEVVAVVLPDGSRVSLAPDSELHYPRGLRGDARAVELTGQGYFEVTSDGRSFTVETFNASVDVLGTEFDVAARGGETIVALAEGSVRLRGADGAVVLAPGEISRVRGAAPTAPVAAEPAMLLAWRDGAFAVENVPLGTVARAIGDRFGRPVRLAPQIDAERRLTLFLPSADSADVVLRDLAAYLDLRVQAAPDRFDLIPR